LKVPVILEGGDFAPYFIPYPVSCCFFLSRCR